MNKKVTLLAALLGLGIQQSNAIELKENVCVVRQNAGDSLLKVYEDVAKQLSNNGYFAAGRAMKGKGKGFGSGMVYKASNGKHYIITNHHVVGSMDYVDLEFEQANGEKKVYSHCRVKGRTTGEDEDVALVELPDTLKFGELIAAHTETLKDGEEVWTAGFPGLGHQPIWQLGKGIISNTIAKPEGYKNGTLIQHTAQVDPGNSGGPLLTKVSRTTGTGKKKKTVETYEVIGLNTWKALFRENTNYSIPFDVAQHFADSIAAQKTVKAKVSLKDRVDSLVTAIKNSDNDKVAEYIQPDMALSRAKTVMAELLASSDEKGLKMLREGETVDALVYLTARNLVANFAKKRETLTWSEVGSEDGDKSTATLLHKGKPMLTNWVKEDGEWKLQSIEGIKTATIRGDKAVMAREGFFIDDPTYDGGIELTYAMNLGNSYHKMFGIRGLIDWRFVNFHYGLICQMAEYVGWDNFEEDYFKEHYGLLGGETGISGQLPLALGHWQIVPMLGINLQGGAWATLDTDKNGKFAIYGVGGAKFGYVTNSGKMPYIRIDYSQPIVKSVEDAMESTVNNLFSIRLGFAH